MLAQRLPGACRRRGRTGGESVSRRALRELRRQRAPAGSGAAHPEAAVMRAGGARLEKIHDVGEESASRSRWQQQQPAERGESVFQTARRVDRVEPLPPWNRVASYSLRGAAVHRIPRDDRRARCKPRAPARAGPIMDPGRSYFPRVLLARPSDGWSERVGSST